jgi:hypothetical protein
MYEATNLQLCSLNYQFARDMGRIRCRNELGAMLHYYYREAA